jgi:hypothetical protein
MLQCFLKQFVRIVGAGHGGVISALEQLRQKDHEFKTSLSHTA